MRLLIPWLLLFFLLSTLVLADVASIGFEQKTLIQGTPQTVTVTLTKTLFDMSDVDMELTLQGPGYFAPKGKKTTIHHNAITKTQADTFTVYLDDQYDGVTSEVNVSYKLTYDTRTGSHIEKGQGSFQGIWSEQSNCLAQLNLCRAAMNSKEQEESIRDQPSPSQGISTIAVLILCLLCLILGGFLSYKVTQHFYPPKQQS
ncbi:MAG: hypothetical protein AABX70_03640 [Nanoarchaeota archaeon]